MRLAGTLGAIFFRYAKEEVRARVDSAPGPCTAGGLLHGGAVMALADSTGA
jgi:1,4-dihydroxy-2-naphthoyl-CoA hydrolase